jgi:pimeloyl-ACP methyl ester carboxylesterase
MSALFKDPLFFAQWLRTAGHAAAGGADLGECIAAAEAIREPEPESWRAAWTRLGERVLGEAEASLSSGRNVSAAAAFLKASNYFRTSYLFLMGPDPDRRLLDAYRQQRSAFEKALAARPEWGEAIAIPFENGALRGYFFRSAGSSPRPTLVLTGGYDSTAEEAYFFSGAAALARGYNFVTFDGPGQGKALIEDGLKFRPDWEQVVASVLAFLAGRPEVDPTRMALMGTSFGGYLAPRAASGNPAFAALIADPGQFGLIEEMKSRLPGFLSRQIPDGSRMALWMIDRMMSRRMRHPTAGWAIRRGLWVHGVERPLDYLRLAAQYTLAGRAELIQCPALISSAENDQIGATARMLYDALAGPKTFQRYTAAEGAGAHCESGARALFNQRAFDWLDSVLSRGCG